MNEILSISDLANELQSPDALRKALRIEDAIRDINEVGEIVREQWSYMDKNQIEACRLRVEVCRIKINKALPDLKAIEHAATDGSGKVQFIINLDGEQKKL